MNPLEISLLAGTVMLVGAVVGVQLRRLLPDHHLTEHAKDVVRLGAGLVATISALVLGLLISTANATYEAQRSEVRSMAADLILLDQLLERYGPESRAARIYLREGTEPLIDRLWGGPKQREKAFEPSATAARTYLALHDLAPTNPTQHALKAQALATGLAIQKSRLMLFERTYAGLPAPFLVVLTFWLTMIFASYCLFTPINPTAAAALVVIALSASGAIFLILEMSHPFEGIMQISSEPLRKALQPLGP
jgi:hypothetical protein